jgi:hypothetical protein
MVKNILKFFYFPSIWIFGFGYVQAQESVNASGADAIGGGGTVAYSIGQIICITNTNNTGSVAQGVQQTYEIYTVDLNEEELHSSTSIFPNPTTKDLTLKINSLQEEILFFRLTDLQGKLLFQEQITSEETQISMVNYPIASYFLTVTNDKDKIVHSFKLIKK